MRSTRTPRSGGARSPRRTTSSSVPDRTLVTATDGVRGNRTLRDVARRTERSDAKPRPGEIDRLLVQQLDISRSVTIGGIVTCIKGLLEYAPSGVALALVGVDDGSSPNHRLGRWETHERGGRTVHFLPVARIDKRGPGRIIPHSARLVAGLLRYRAAIPRPKLVQAHRLDVAM